MNLEDSFRKFKTKVKALASGNVKSDDVGPPYDVNPSFDCLTESLQKRLNEAEKRCAQTSAKIDNLTKSNPGPKPMPRQGKTLPFIASVTSKPSYSIVTSIQSINANKRLGLASASENDTVSKGRSQRETAVPSTGKRSFTRPTKSSQAKAKDIKMLPKRITLGARQDNLKLIRQAQGKS